MSTEDLPDRLAEFLSALVEVEYSMRTLGAVGSSESLGSAGLRLQRAGENFTPFEAPVIMGVIGGMWASYVVGDQEVLHPDERIEQARDILSVMISGEQ